MTNLNKILLALGLSSAVVLVGCNKEKTPDSTTAKPMDQMEAPSDKVGEQLREASETGFNETSQATKGATASMEKGATTAALATKKVAEGTGQAANEATGESRVLDHADEREARDNAQHREQAAQ